MSSFGDVRDYVAALPHVTHGHATQGSSLKEGPIESGYALYPPRCALLECLLELQAPTGSRDPELECALFEFGTLNGYAISALGVTARLAGWSPRIGWCDDESTEPGSNEKARENVASLGLDASFVCTDRRDAPLFGTALMVAVDGDHSHESTMDDIAYASMLRPGVIVVDDLIPTHQGVINACWKVSHLFLDAFYIDTVNGLGVLDATGGLRQMMIRHGWQVSELPA